MQQVDGIGDVPEPRQGGKAQRSPEAAARGNDHEGLCHPQDRADGVSCRREQHDPGKAGKGEKAGQVLSAGPHQPGAADPMRRDDATEEALQDPANEQRAPVLTVQYRREDHDRGERPALLPAAPSGESEQWQRQVEQPLVAQRPRDVGDQQPGSRQAVQVGGGEHGEQQPIPQWPKEPRHGWGCASPRQDAASEQPQDQQLHRIEPVQPRHEKFHPVEVVSPNQDASSEQECSDHEEQRDAGLPQFGDEAGRGSAQPAPCRKNHVMTV